MADLLDGRAESVLAGQAGLECHEMCRCGGRSVFRFMPDVPRLLGADCADERF